MIQNLPTWNFNNLKPSFDDLESATAVEMVYKLYGKNRELIDDYNKFLKDIQNEIEAFKTSTNQDMECFKANITKICNDYIATMDMKIDCQDRKIAEIYEYLKENLTSAITTMISSMKESGELEEIILDALDNVTTKINELEEKMNNKIDNLHFDSVEEMKNATLQAGDIVQTLGYYNANDGGQGLYKIRERIDTDEIDNGILHAIGSELIAELVINKRTINPNIFGARGDGETDDTACLQKCINYAIANKLNIDIIGNYLVNPKTMSDNTKVCLTLFRDSTDNSHMWDTGIEIYFKREASIFTNFEEECSLLRFNICNISIVNPFLKGVKSKTTLIEFSKINQLDTNETQWTCHNIIRNAKLQSAKRCISMQGNTYYNTFDKVYIHNTDFGIIMEQTTLEKNGTIAGSNVNRNEFLNVIMTTVSEGGIRIEYGDTNKFVNLSFEGVANPLYLDCPQQHRDDFAIIPKWYTNDNMFVNVTYEATTGKNIYNNAKGSKFINVNAKYESSNFIIAPGIYIGGVDNSYSPEIIAGLYKSLEELAIVGAKKYSIVFAGVGGMGSKSFYDVIGDNNTGITTMNRQIFEFDNESSENVSAISYENTHKMLAKSIGGIIFISGKTNVVPTDVNSNIELYYPSSLSWLKSFGQIYQHGNISAMTIPIAVNINGTLKQTFAHLRTNRLIIVKPEGGWHSSSNQILLNYTIYRDGVDY